MTECIVFLPIIVIVCIIIAIKIISFQRIFSSREYYKQFTHIKETGNFEEVKPLFNFNGEKEISVLLIHGFSASSSEFRFLTDEFKKNNISFYAPTLTGFGLDDYHLLYKIKYSDWLRDVVNAHDLLKGVSDNVIVIGHSMGGLLAFHLSYLRPLKKVIMTNPYLIVKSEHRFSKVLLLNPFMWGIIRTFNPILSKEKKGLKKESEISGISKRFAIPIFPLSIVWELWELLEKLDLKKISIEKLHIYFGKKDSTVLPQNVRGFLQSNKVLFSFTEYENSGHNILEDIENKDVIKSILEKIEND